MHQPTLDRLNEQGKAITKEVSNHKLQEKLKKFNDRWKAALAALDSRNKEMTQLLESGPSRQFLDTMETVLRMIKNSEAAISDEFRISSPEKLDEQLKMYKVRLNDDTPRPV